MAPVLLRNPGIVWREERPLAGQKTVGPDDPAVTLIDGGMMHQLNQVGGAIWKSADGTKGVEEIIDELARVFNVDRNELSRDVIEFVDQLVAKGWLQYGS